ncbi:gamma-glutamylcyclotransferase [Vibrio sp. SCSIO 43135]|uniref:Gamma-glutamylcyclotransferase family protein n=1 Tax=Vibrio paucivorans TaxID=2829489 RepID=A0A9X3CCX9_9VIBR|nr:MULTISPECIES: gamma-glutamylcyclotransferase [Vibrio]MCW8333164.1 gamma-glutamylcyclotransferase [Vibrio paucivorans]USD41447.1 gamma-glutamylcyclotransferase [Vibrio sp. SCSIO 43135]
MQHLVFVYGTLRQGEVNSHLLANSELLGQFETGPHYALFDLGEYPAISDGEQSILGEVYRIDDTTLANLDVLEDVPNEYRRSSLDTPFGKAWVYLYQDESKLSVPIQSGDWCYKV